MTQAFGVGCILLGGVYYSVPFMIISARIFWLGYLVICLSVSLWRGAYYLIHHVKRRIDVFFYCIGGRPARPSDNRHID